MKNECTDPKIGDLLHAYELKLLDDNEKDRFETHLLSCNYCYNEVKSFAPRGAMLSGATDVGRALREKMKEDDGRISVGEKLRRLLWPKTPILLRPALLYIVCLLMLIPSYLGLKSFVGGERGDSLKSVQVIYLTTARSSYNNVFEIEAGDDGIISFSCPGAVMEKSYRLEILTGGGETVFVNSDFDGFDERGTAQLLFPNRIMKNGDYRLIIKDMVDGKSLVLCNYEFGVR